MNNYQDIQPVFLVGCPRSGTTLLQSLIASHPKITSFPETKFFLFGIPRLSQPERLLFGLTARSFHNHLINWFTNDIKRPEFLNTLPNIPILTWYMKRLIEILNELTIEQGNYIWLEKTPDHIYHIPYIEKMLPDAKFIHLLRQGTDVIASLYEVTRKYPKFWSGEWSIDLCLRQWQKAIISSINCQNKTNHLFIRYENLVKEPVATLQKVCDFINVDFDDQMLDKYEETSRQLISYACGRIIIKDGILFNKPNKFDEIFNKKEKDYILQKLYKFQINRQILEILGN